jgi:hypothetical protein
MVLSSADGVNRRAFRSLATILQWLNQFESTKHQALTALLALCNIQLPVMTSFSVAENATILYMGYQVLYSIRHRGTDLNHLVLAVVCEAIFSPRRRRNRTIWIRRSPLGASANSVGLF